ncbi:MAG: cadherin domain-containing protein [Xanthomonadales bacterium]|nr:cadherin domain-containing protein [Xanthomonadales bacterium]
MPGSAPQIDAALGENIFCFESAGASGAQLQTSDTNQQAMTVSGLSALRYRTSDRVFEVETTSALTCFAPPAAPEFTYLTAGESGSCEQGEQLFITSFEQAQNEPPSDVVQFRMDLRVQQSPATQTGDELIYEIVVQNCTGASLNNVAVRGFFPSTGSQESTVLQQAPTATDCAGLASCVNVNGYLKYLIPELPASSTHTVQVSRPLAQGLPGDMVRLTAVSALDPGSSTLPAHEAKSWDVPVVDTNNIPPVLNLAVETSPFVMDEDAGPTTLTGFTLVATDEDTGFANCGDGSCVSVSSSPSGLVSNVNAGFDVGTGTVTLEVTPQANAFGDGTLEVSVFDDAGAESSPVSIALSVAAVNDPPTFEIAQGFDRTAVSKSLTLTGSTYCVLTQGSANGDFVLEDPACPTQSWEASPTFPDDGLIYNAWIRNVSGGPNEVDAATVNVTVESNPQGIIENWIYDAETAQLIYDLASGAKGSAQLRVTADDGQRQTSVLVDISVDNAQPVIDGGATSTVTFDENATGVITTVTATDADDAASALSYAITGGPDEALFSLDSVSGELTFVTPPDFEAPLDADGDNGYEVVVTVSDGSGGTDSQSIAVTVQDVNEPPVIVLAQATFSVSSSAGEGDVVVPASNYDASSDPEGSTLTNWRILSGNTKTDTGSLKPFAINAVSGEISVNDPSNFASTTTTQFTLAIVVADAASGGLDSDPAEIVIDVQ